MIITTRGLALVATLLLSPVAGCKDKASAPTAPPAPLATELRTIAQYGLKVEAQVPTGWSKLEYQNGGFSVAEPGAQLPEEWMVFRQISGIGQTPAELAREHGTASKGVKVVLEPGEAAPGRFASATRSSGGDGRAGKRCVEVNVFWLDVGVPYHCHAETCSNRWKEYLDRCLAATLSLAAATTQP